MRLARSPADPKLAAELAYRYYRLAQREGDPRYIGYAQAALAPWWQAPDPPLEALVLRAVIKQHLHEFEAALRDLDRALVRDPDHFTARSFRAVILIVQARYREAERDCLGLGRISDSLIAAACQPTVDALTGKAATALEALERELARRPDAPPDERLWALTRLAEIAQRLDRARLADRTYRRALELGIDDQYLLSAYADFLLDQNRPAEVVQLLAGHERNDVLLLRLAIAEKVLGLPPAAEHRAALQARFDAARLRNDTLHLSDEARFALDVLGRAEVAARLARDNWDLGQREPSDARILLEAALAANRSDLARPALAWLAASGNEDVALRRLAGRIAAAR